jgi:nucleoid-associated protein YgaU
LPLLNSRAPTTSNHLADSHRPLSATFAPARISPFQPRPLVVAPSALLDSPTASLASPGVARRVSVDPLPSRERVALRRLQVRRGDSWWKLAARYLGSGARWPKLRSLNAALHGPPEFLMLGSSVLVPEKETAGKRSSGRSITVKKGDSLWVSAHEHLGNSNKWIWLARANPQILDCTHLAIGMTLQLPTDEALESYRSWSSDKLQQ